MPGDVCLACLAARETGGSCAKHGRSTPVYSYGMVDWLADTRHRELLMDEVHKPPHYQLPGHPDIECIDVIEALELDLLLGSAFQYLWRAGRKGGKAKAIVDLQKARWYIDRKIGQLHAQLRNPDPAGPDPTDGTLVVCEHSECKLPKPHTHWRAR